MKTTLRILLLSAMALPAVSCLRDPLSETNANLVLKAEVESIVVPADTPGADVQEKTIQFTCNRSWSAFFEPEAPWISLSVEEFENIARTEEPASVTLSFTNNEDRLQERSTNLVISTADGNIRIPVRQGKQVPYITLSTPARVEDISCMEETSVVKFGSNIAWKATVEEGATAQVTLDKTSGKGDGEIAVRFAENQDVDVRPEAVLVLDGSEAGLETLVKVYFKQGQAQPYIKWISTDQLYASSFAGSVDLEFKTNSTWEAALTEAVDGITLAATAGTKEDHILKVNIGDFFGLDNTRSAGIRLSLATGETATLTVTQKANALFLDFVAGNQPFTQDIPYSTPVTAQTDYTLSCGGKDYPFTFYAPKSGYTYYNNADGKTCGIMYNQGDWILLPGVEGKSLKTVRVYTSNMGSSANKGFGLRDTPSGSNLASQYVSAHEAWATLTLKSPEQGKAYYLVSLNNTAYFSRISLEYE